MRPPAAGTCKLLGELAENLDADTHDHDSAHDREGDGHDRADSTHGIAGEAGDGRNERSSDCLHDLHLLTSYPAESRMYYDRHHPSQHGKEDASGEKHEQGREEIKHALIEIVSEHVHGQTCQRLVRIRPKIRPAMSTSRTS